MSSRYPVQSLGGKVLVYTDTNAVAEVHRGWVAGQYVEGMPDIPFEVKFSVNHKGDARTEWSAPGKGITWARVMQGSTTIDFLINGAEESITLGEGQAIYFPNDIPHKWTVCKDHTAIFTVRTKI